MPLAAIAAIASLAASGAAVGNTVYSDLNQPSAGTSTAPTPAQTTTNAIAAETQKRQAQATSDAQLLPGLQANTGGGLSPDAYSSLASQFNGDAGGNNPQLQAMVANFLGQGQGASFGGTTPFGTGNTAATNPSSPGIAG